MDKQGIGYTLNGKVNGDETHYGYRFADAKAFLVTKEGANNVKVYPFEREDICLIEAKKCWVCWVSYNNKAQEIGSGGVGFAHKNIRENGPKWLAQRYQQVWFQ